MLQTLLRALPIEREMLRAAAAFLALGLVPFVREKMFQRREQARAKLAMLGVQALEIILFQEPREECLREIFGILLRVTFAPDVSVERKPIAPAKLAQRAIRLRRGLAPGGQHHRPARRDEILTRRAGLLGRRL